MNHDDNHPDNPAANELALEARVVAWVSGEASAFEAAELERLIGEKPELAIFKRRIEAVRGLVAEAIRPDREPLVMSAHRRAKLLEALGAPQSNPAPSVVPLTLPKARRIDRQWRYAIAALLMVGFVSVLTISYRRIAPEADFKELAMRQGYSVALPNVSDASALERRKGSELSAESAKRAEIDTRAKIDAAGRANQREAQPGPAFHAMMDAEPRPSGGAGMILDRPEIVSSPNAVAVSAATDSTLAGRRVRTELKDVASATSAVTDQFLRDTGAAGKQEVLADKRSNETYVAQGNFAAAPAKGGLSAENAPGAALEARAQGAATEGDEKTIVLSPFEVTAAPGAGGAPKKALAGAVAGKLIGSKEKSSDDREDSDLPIAKPAKPEQPTEETPEVNAAKQPVSTFSLHVSDVSFRLARAALAKNEEIDEEAIRPEEFYNAFDYGDPAPAMAEKVSCRIEQAAHPFLQQRNLVRIAIKVPATGRDAAQPLRLTVLLDTSGSMEREDRAAIAHRAMAALVSLLGPNDRLTLIGFARQPRLLAESLSGDKAGQALEIAAHTPSEGGTNLEEALKLARQLAQRQFDPAAQNRVVVLTDGAANLGAADPVQLAAAVDALRQQGVAFDACGVGLDGLNDAMLERLTRKGAGRYYVLNSPDEADAGFARQLAGAFHPAAENVKLQVRFNPARVGNYRLVGFEQHRLREEDFRNDNVAAAALAAEEAAVAVYQVEALPQGEGELGEVYVRFRDAASGSMVERSWTLGYDARAAAFDQATPTMQLAGTAALLAEKLRGGPAGEAVKLGDLAPVVNKLRSHYAGEPRVQELVTMFEQMRRLSGE